MKPYVQRVLLVGKREFFFVLWIWIDLVNLCSKRVAMNRRVNGGMGKRRRGSRLSKSVETSCVVRSEHRAAKGGMNAGEGQRGA